MTKYFLVGHLPCRNIKTSATFNLLLLFSVDLEEEKRFVKRTHVSQHIYKMFKKCVKIQISVRIKRKSIGSKGNGTLSILCYCIFDVMKKIYIRLLSMVMVQIDIPILLVVVVLVLV